MSRQWYDVKSYDEEFKLKVLSHAKEFGVKDAVDKFFVKYHSVYNWNKTYKVFDTERLVNSDKLKLEVMEFVEAHGVKKATEEYGINRSTVYAWKKYFLKND